MVEVCTGCHKSNKRHLFVQFTGFLFISRKSASLRTRDRLRHIKLISQRWLFVRIASLFVSLFAALSLS